MMLFRLLIVFFILLEVRPIQAQADSSVLRAPYSDAIYLSYEDFRHNVKITKDEIITELDKRQLEFLTKVLTANEFRYSRNGKAEVAMSHQVWGYFQNNTFYINYKNEFYRVPVFGAFSYLVATVRVASPGFYDPRFGTTTVGGTTQEIREFMMDAADGQVRELTLSAAETVLQRDAELYAEYKKLSKRKQKEELYRYIRKYNQKHEIYYWH